MNYSLRITKTAEDDLRAAADYIEFKLLNPQAADALLAKAEEELSKLSHMPESHQLAYDPVLNEQGIRYTLVDRYMAFFVIDESTKTVYIIRFIYGKRNWISILKNEPLALEE